MSKTNIRAVEMVRSIRDQIYEETKQLSPEEFIAFIARESARASRETESGRPSSGRPAA
jgi:hypothetical protein